ncbi:acyltransferase [Paenarthrobacter sp. DKR-5]|uniref:acyltransferase family protein n=1 Tax=Paenarthrobacter sp. DKR-5 TaxID=2835535 RepID=UPI001BDC09C0|nr:acyltransferase [Paenarthrobacter sp. DKR-5]MBT1001204.1 acyltransferase [Paenarthrobacter sp. DKR-5]
MRRTAGERGTSTPHPLDGSAARPRDLVVDLVRAGCLLMVPAVHLLMIGVYAGPGGVVVENTLSHQTWFAQGSWFGQIMPLFFVMGGFTGLTAWRSLSARGGDGWDFLRARMLRMVRPAAAAFGFIAAALWIAAMLGAPPALLDLSSRGVAMPVWFLAAYLICQSLVPFMAKLHAARPLSSIAVIFTFALVLDMLSFTTVLSGVGVWNMLFVWLFIQQLGFFYADGWFKRRRWWELLGAVLACYGLLWWITYDGPYAKDMLVNLNPPTICLILLGIAQICTLQLILPALEHAMSWRWLQFLVGAVGRRAMTLYLWHLPLFALIIVVSLLLHVPTPVLGSAQWWWTRPLLALAVLPVLIPVVWLAGKLELHPVALEQGRQRQPWPVIAGALAVVIGQPVLLAQAGVTPETATVAALGLAGAAVVTALTTEAAENGSDLE